MAILMCYNDAESRLSRCRGELMQCTKESIHRQRMYEDSQREVARLRRLLTKAQTLLISVDLNRLNDDAIKDVEEVLEG
jgi:hypothetical protein